MLARNVSDLIGPSSGAFCPSCICRLWYVVILCVLLDTSSLYEVVGRVCDNHETYLQICITNKMRNSSCMCRQFPTYVRFPYRKFCVHWKLTYLRMDLTATYQTSPVLCALLQCQCTYLWKKGRSRLRWLHSVLTLWRLMMYIYVVPHS